MNINTITAEDLRRMPDKEGHIMVGFAAAGVCVSARISVLHRPGRQRNNMPGWL